DEPAVPLNSSLQIGVELLVMVLLLMMVVVLVVLVVVVVVLVLVAVLVVVGPFWWRPPWAARDAAALCACWRRR
ncbi:MAG TPA: hypothetical protein VGF70_05575, partial [Solirubrobacteraceae bacterium]